MTTAILTPYAAHLETWDANGKRVRLWNKHLTATVDSHFAAPDNDSAPIYAAMDDSYLAPGNMDAPADVSVWVSWQTDRFSLDEAKMTRGIVTRENADYCDLAYFVDPEETLEDLQASILLDLGALTMLDR